MKMIIMYLTTSRYTQIIIKLEVSFHRSIIGDIYHMGKLVILPMLEWNYYKFYSLLNNKILRFINY